MEDDKLNLDGAVFDLDITDEDVKRTTIQNIRDAKTYWNDKKGQNLDQVRSNAKNYWVGKHYEDTELYEHQTPYMDPRIFTSTETVIAIVNSRTPQPEVFPAQDSVTSQVLAKDMEKGLFRYAEKQRLSQKLRIATRHLLMYRVGILKQRFDPSKGRFGEIITEVVDPAKLIFDKDAGLWDECRFIAEEMTDTIYDLLLKFPEKEKEILDKYSIKRKTTKALGRMVDYHEVWFTYYDKKEEREKECLAWILDEEIVLGKMTNPNWIDETDGSEKKNFFDNPQKPYITMNFLNLGDHKVDNTSILEQAIPQQDVLNKRGRQITDNADAGSGGMVYNTTMIEKKDIARLIGAPDEKVGVSGDVNRAVARLAPPFLPDYVVQDKFDARQQIDNIFGAHAPSRGESSGNATLGQDVLQQQQDQTRQEELVRAVEDSSDRLYKHTIQMMKVYYTEEHFFKTTGENGQFDFVAISADKIEDGLDLEVRQGTSLPINKMQVRNDSVQLAQAGLIDPLTLYENLGFQDPQKMVERLIDWTTDPMKFVQTVREEEFERDAFTDIQILNRGQLASPRSEPTVEHLDYHTQYMMSGEFQDLDDEVKELHQLHLEMETENAKRILDMLATQLPSKEEMKEAGQEAIEEEQQMQQLEGGMSPRQGSPTQQGMDQLDPQRRVQQEPRQQEPPEKPTQDPPMV